MTAPPTQFPPPATVFDLFARSITAHPDATAIEVGEDQLTYAELARRVDALAHAVLERCGGQAPRRIGLLALRSTATYVAYLAVQRLGSSVVPLNPAFPEARNRSIAEAAGLGLLLTESPDVPPGVPVLDPVIAGTGHQPEENRHLPAPRTGGADEAYVLYTSGSTGTPKGVPIRHDNVLPYVQHVVSRYGIGRGCRLSQTFDLTFDPSVFDMFAAWASGATLVVPSRGDLLAPARFVRSQGITHWFSVPSIVSFADRLHGLAEGTMPALRWALFAGEALTLKQAAAWKRAAPSCVIENIYGPTELTVTCAEYRLPDAVGDWPATSNGTVPIGEIYPHLEHVVVDAEGRRASDGELCVRGSQRFHGYADPADDAGRFFDEVGGRFLALGCAGSTATLTEKSWYRTGDRVRREGGQLLHLGRLDSQLKVRGYRIELGEVECAIRRLDGVGDAVVVPVASADGETELVAAYTGDTACDGEELGEQLRTSLPGYMVPRRLIRMDQLPLNANGKTDRNAILDDLTSISA